MDTIEVRTDVYLPPEEVYAFLIDFPRYARYSKHLTDVRQYGDGTPGTAYELDFSWWKLTYTARSRVSAVDPPNRIDWTITKDLDAAGYWQVEPIEGDGADHSRVTLHVEYAPGSVDDGILDLPGFVSLDWVVQKVKPKVKAEAERVVRRIVADIEGERRDVELQIETR
ncbi:MAG: SRPBCC family protein [Natronomonas sp.]